MSFKFFSGSKENNNTVGPTPTLINQTVTQGILNGAVSGEECAPYSKRLNGVWYESEIMDLSRNEWHEIRISNPEFIYLLYAIFKPRTRWAGPSVIQFYGNTNSDEAFPSFVTNNPNIRYTFEFIKIPNLI